MLSNRIIFLFIFFILAFAPIAAADTIFIHTDNINDLNSLENNNKIASLSAATNLHALALEQQNIQFEYMNTKRSLALMAKGENVCAVNKIKTKQRLSKYIFSKPINLFLSRRLYQNASYSPIVKTYDGINKQVTLSEVFNAKPESQVIVSGHISYGDNLDRQIAALDNKNKIERFSSEHETGLINMFAKGRAEFALLYPQQVYSFENKINFRSYEVATTSPYILGHLMCTNNVESKKFIQRINQQLEHLTNNGELLNVHLSFVNPEEKAIFQHYFYQEF